MNTWLGLLLIGAIGGVASGMFGIGGGIVLVPAMVYWAGFTQHMATGTSLAVLLPPIGLAATIEYYRRGNVDLRAAAILAVGMLAGSYLGAIIANRHLSGPQLRLTFGVFLFCLSIYLIYGACKRLGWIS